MIVLFTFDDNGKKEWNNQTNKNSEETLWQRMPLVNDFCEKPKDILRINHFKVDKTRCLLLTNKTKVKIAKIFTSFVLTAFHK